MWLYLINRTSASQLSIAIEFIPFPSGEPNGESRDELRACVGYETSGESYSQASRGSQLDIAG